MIMVWLGLNGWLPNSSRSRKPETEMPFLYLIAVHSTGTPVGKRELREPSPEHIMVGRNVMVMIGILELARLLQVAWKKGRNVRKGSGTGVVGGRKS